MFPPVGMSPASPQEESRDGVGERETETDKERRRNTERHTEREGQRVTERRGARNRDRGGNRAGEQGAVTAAPRAQPPPASPALRPRTMLTPNEGSTGRTQHRKGATQSRAQRGRPESPGRQVQQVRRDRRPGPPCPQLLFPSGQTSKASG